MIRELRIYLRLRPYIKQLQKLAKENTGMKLSWNVITQVVGIAVQGANALSDLVPEYKAIIASGVGLVQALVAFLAHFRNPDGTDARTAYIPPIK